MFKSEAEEMGIEGPRDGMGLYMAMIATSDEHQGPVRGVKRVSE